MKGLTVFLLLFIPLWSYPQGVFTNHTHSTLQQVLSDYPNRFQNIKGEETSRDPQITNYASKVEIPGAINTVITRYSGAENEKEVYSWKCVLNESEDFENASKKYQEVFNQLKNSIMKIRGEKPLILNGTYQAPTDEKRFNSSSLQLVPAAPGDLGKVKVELTMEYLVTEWKVSLLVYDQEEESLVME